MDTTLELVFLATDGRTVRISVNDPKENLDEELIKNVMNQILLADVFQASSGASLASIKEARIVSRSTEVFNF
ncbi:DUF2922 domain-containing protein [Bacillus andreraoultii]|uniref:DUF2922 domain-containing protein n=1 Tax=Bacillus andreraoultii TaxID=1499685 RepID=UPI00053A9E89|nr:DUF2922 domain-containing protein [Bacillus andreraoultii]